MLKIRNARRTVAVAATILAVAGGTTFATAGTAQADSNPVCNGPWAGGGAGSPWYSWKLGVCIVEGDDGGFYSSAIGIDGSTDVRIYVGILDTCNGVIYNTNNGLAYPNTAEVSSNGELFNNECALEGVAWLTESGHSSPRIYSSTIHG